MDFDANALDAVLHTLKLTLESTPARWSEDTADELFTLVQLTFHDYTAAVLSEDVLAGTPEDGKPPLAVRAALHCRAIADLLTALAISYWREGDDDLTAIGRAEAPATLTARWLEEIADAALGPEQPTHDSAADYVRGVSIGLSFVTRILGAQRGLSLDPDDPRGPVEPPEGALTGDDAGALLIWCGAAALCIAARLQPRFRIAPAS